ncbi:cadherin-89D-like isoform X2 [Macrobrachium nipponense]|uniref:cadherin-89D-like isoform X2 n=1 Tax=Macrobrachium nipponense TaxID=159736 RepID=UPI0030C87B05
MKERNPMTSSTRLWFLWLIVVGLSYRGNACDWGPEEDLRRFVRVREDAPIGHEILTVNVTDPGLLAIESSTQGSEGIFRVEAVPRGGPGHGSVVQDGDGVLEEALGVGRVVVAAPLKPLLQEGSTVNKVTLVCGTNQVSLQLTIYVEDVNDHAPVFLLKNMTVTVDELTPVGLTILPEIRVKDEDKPNTANSEVELQLASQGNAEFQYFAMSDRKRGTITLAKTLDYDAGPKEFHLQIVAKDMGIPSLSSTATVTVVVLDADDLPPAFAHPHYTAKISEDPGPDAGVIIRRELEVKPERISAWDGDVGQNASLRYSLVDSQAAHYFTLDPDSGRLYLTKHLDRENLTDPTLTLHIRAEQVDNPRRVGSSVVEIEVEDVNDNLPSFTHDVYSISIVENLPSGFSVVQVSATDPDEGLNGAFNYHVVGGNGALTVNPLSGWLTVANHNILDREESPVINLHVCANQITPLVKFPGGPISKRVLLENPEDQELERFSEPKDLVQTTTESSLSFETEPATEFGSFGEVTTTRPYRNRRLKSVRPLRNTADLARRGTVEVGNIDLETTEGIERSRTIAAGPLLRNVVQPTIPPADSSATLVTPSDSGEPYDFGRRLSSLREVDTAGNRDSRGATDENVPFVVTPGVKGSHNIRRRFNRRAPVRSVNPHFRRRKRNSNPSRLVLIRRRKSKNIDEMTGDVSDVTPIANLPPEVKSSSCAKVELRLLDANDNNPVFLPSNQYKVTLQETMKVGEVVGKVTAEDLDEGGNGQIIYKIQSRAHSGHDTSGGSIQVDRVTGNLTLAAAYPPGQYTVFIEASDSPSNPSETRTSLAVVNIEVESGPDPSQPRFIGAPFELWVGGDAPVGTSIGQVRVADMDGPELIFDMFHAYEEGVPFAIEETSGIVSVLKPLQEFSRQIYRFEAVVTDGRNSLATNLTVHVAPSVAKPVTNRRDNMINFTIQENLSGGLVGDLMLALRNMGVRLAPDPQFELVSPEARKHFALAQDATLYTVAPLDYEAHPNHTLVVVSARTSDIFYVNVQVEDVNDNPPQLNAVSYEGLIRENALPGTIVRLLPTIQVSDADKYPGATFSLELSGEAASLFSIDSSDGTVKFVGESLDREAIDSYYLHLEARDDGNLTSKANLSIIVEDVNDNRPKFVERDALFSSRQGEENNPRKLSDASNLKFMAELERSLVRVPESLPVGSQVTKVAATDEDDRVFGDIHYGIEAQKSFEFSDGKGNTPPILQSTNKFSIEGKTGIVVVTGVLEPDHFYILNISATDGGGLSSYTTVAIAVFDVNDNAPRFERPVYSFQVAEGEYLVGEVGKVTAVDQDLGDNGKVRYHITFLNNSNEDQLFPFRVVETSGTILATGAVDREKRDSYEFSVVATDMGEPQLSSSVLVHIDVTDVNDHAPVFYGYQEILSLPDDTASSSSSQNNNYIPVYIANVSESAPSNTFLAQIFANDTDSSGLGNGIILYGLEGSVDKFAIDSKNGSIYTVGALDYERWPVHNVTVVAQDLGNPPLTSTALLSITVVDVEEELTTRLFEREEYRVVVEENNNTPLRLLDLNVSDAYTNHKLQYRLLNPELAGIVAVDAMTGQVYLTASLDREARDSYRFKVKAVQPDRGRSLDSQLNEEDQYLENPIPTDDAYPHGKPRSLVDTANSSLGLDSSTAYSRNATESNQNSENLMRVPAEIVPLLSSASGRKGRTRPFPQEQGHRKQETSTEGERAFLSMDEVWIKIIVKDQNDNTPKFLPHGRPIVAAVPSTASYGHFVTRIMAHDPDLGVNGEIRYEILPGEGSEDATSRFAVDPTTGQMVVVGTLTEEAGRMFGFDVKATDQRGAPTGRTAIANVFVHVLGQGRHLVVEVGATPRDVEPHLNNIQGMLTNVSGFDVRVQRIAPHVDGDAAHTTATDVYVYAVDPVSQAVVEAAELRQALKTKKNMLRKLLPSGLHYKGMRFPVPPREGHVLQTAELAILIGAVVVFLVTVTTVVCLCYKQRKSRRKPMPLPPIMAAAGLPVMPLAYPGPFATAAPYTHMSDHSSADSSEAPDGQHDPAAFYHPEVTHYPHAPTHYRRQPPRRRSCNHNYQGDHELLHSGNSERVSSHTDEDDPMAACFRHAPSKKRRRGGPPGVPGGAAAMGGGVSGSRSFGHLDRTSRVQQRLRDDHSSSDLDERDHAPPQVNIPRPQKCCPEERQRVNPNLPRALTTIDCSLENSTRPHSPDSLERPRSRHQHSNHQHHQHHHHQHQRSRSHTLQRAPTQRERSVGGVEDVRRPAGKPLLHPSDITEL